MALLLVVLLDLAFRLAVTRESPLWFHAEQLVARLGGPGVAEGRLLYALGFALLGGLLAALLWFRFGRVAAILLLLLAGWEVYGRARQAQLALAEGWALGLPMIAGIAAALLLLTVAVMAAAGTFGQARRKRWWR